jgi:hypothetical protein
MSVGRPARLAWWLAGACVGLVLSSLVLLLVVSHGGDVSQYYYEDAAVAVAFALLGAVVAAHRPENPIGWLFLAIGLSGALGVVSNEYVNYALVVDPGALPGGPLAAWLSAWTWWPAYGLVPIVLLVFPDGRLPSPRWRWAAWLAGGGVAVMTLGIAASTLGDPVRFALSEEEPGGLPGLVLAVSVSAAIVSFLAALVSLALRWRRAWGNEREQLEWVAFAGGRYRLVHQDRLRLELVVAPGADLAGLGEAQTPPEAGDLVVAADHAEAEPPDPRPAGEELALQGLDAGRPDALALAASVDQQQPDVERLVVRVAQQHDEEEEHGGELLPAWQLQEPPPEVVVGEDLPVGVHHHLRDRLLLLGEDSCAGWSWSAVPTSAMSWSRISRSAGSEAVIPPAIGDRPAGSRRRRTGATRPGSGCGRPARRPWPARRRGAGPRR